MMYHSQYSLTPAEPLLIWMTVLVAYLSILLEMMDDFIGSLTFPKQQPQEESGLKQEILLAVWVPVVMQKDT